MVLPARLRPIIIILIAFLAWRLILLVISFWAVSTYGTYDFVGHSMKPFNAFYDIFNFGSLINSQSNWDGWQYISISQRGFLYEYQYAFFPLLSFLIFIITTLTPLHAGIAGLLITNGGFLLSLVMLYHLCRLDYDEETSLRIIFLLLIFPASFFYGMIYTESLFLLFSVLCFYFLRKEKFLALALSGFLLAVEFSAPPSPSHAKYL